MVNNFGKFCRKLRIDNGQLLSGMAKELGVSSAFLSKVENGSKKPPKNWRDQIIASYKLDPGEIAKLDDCLFEAMNKDSIDISGYSDESKEMLLSFARKLDSMDAQKKCQFKKLIGEKDGGMGD